MVALLVLAAFALPAVIGPATEKQLRQAIADANQQQGVIEATVTSYERSYRSATATINIGLSQEYLQQMAGDGSDSDEKIGELLGAVDNLIPLQLEIEHGPVLMKFAKGLGLNSVRTTLGDNEALTAIRDKTGITDILEVVGKTGLTGSGAFDIKMPPMQAAFDRNGTLDFSGLNGDATWNNGSQRLIMKAKSDATKVSDDVTTFLMEGMTMDIDSRFVQSNLAVGTSTFDIAHVEFESFSIPDAPSMSLDKLGFVTDVSLGNNDLMNIGVTYNVGQAVAGEFNISDATARVEFNNIKPEVVEKYQELAANPVMDAAQIAALQDLLYDALTSSPELNIGPVRFMANGETFDGIMNVTVDSAALPDASTFNFMDPGMWMGVISQTLDVNATEGLVNEIAEGYMLQQIIATAPQDQQGMPADLQALVEQQRQVMLDQLIGQGMITRTDTGYAVDVDFDKGEMTVNGNPFPIEALLGP